MAGVVHGTMLTHEVTPPGALAKHRAVLMNCCDAGGRFGSVVPAERRGGAAATRAPIAAGHRRIAFITGEDWMDAAMQRRKRDERARRAAGIAVDPDLIAAGTFLPGGGRSTTRDLMARDIRPDAIFCANDLMAVGCYAALKELGEKIGATIAVMGYGDLDIAQHLSPALSTVQLAASRNGTDLRRGAAVAGHRAAGAAAPGMPGRAAAVTSAAAGGRTRP